ncbi:Crp/Fnr family transcriptional regulator [Acidobacteria bacterium AH-259-A15]|nr:Crp/Fnr family transcriptional regulator [Acidobacteria bacterium AH-259-A15]
MLTTVEKVLLLQDLDFFRFAYSEHLAQLASICQEKEIPKDTLLFRKGEPYPTLYLLVKGRVSLELGEGKTNTAEKRVLDFWPFLAEGKHQVTAQAAEDCVLLAVPFKDMVDLLTAEPELCWAIMRYVARRALSASIPK